MCANMKLPIVHKPCVHIDSWSTDNCLLRYIVTTAFWPIECTDMYLNDVPHVQADTKSNAYPMHADACPTRVSNPDRTYDPVVARQATGSDCSSSWYSGQS